MPPSLRSLIDLARQGDREPLASALRDMLLKCLLRQKVPLPDAEDLVQHKVLKLLRYLEGGRATPGKEEPYVVRCGNNLAKSFFRTHQRQQERFEDQDPSEEGEPEDSSRFRDEEEEQRREHFRDLDAVLESGVISEAEKELLEDVYLREIPIEELARRDLAANPKVLRGPRKDTPRTPEQARNTLDQRLTRARARVQAAMNDLRERRSS